VNTNPKLRVQNGVQTKFSSLKCGKNLESGNLKSRKIIHYLYGVLARTTKMNLKFRKILNQKTFNGDSVVHMINLPVADCLGHVEAGVLQMYRQGSPQTKLMTALWADIWLCLAVDALMGRETTG
jgi:hypothetical protein